MKSIYTETHLGECPRCHDSNCNFSASEILCPKCEFLEVLPPQELTFMQGHDCETHEYLGEFIEYIPNSVEDANY